MSFPDVFSWIENLPPVDEWKNRNPINNSLNLCPTLSSSSSSLQPSLKLSLTNFTNSHVSLSITADYNNFPISLWTSKKLIVVIASKKLLDNEITISTLIHNFISDILKYSPNKWPKPPTLQANPTTDKDIFNFSFLTLTFIVCIYEAPADLRATCLDTFKDHLTSRGASKVLMMLLGSNIEEHWMRSVNLAITNWTFETTNGCLKTPCSLFSYSLSLLGLWKVQLYCPVIAMHVEKSSGSSSDDLMFSLNFHQLEGVIQLNYRVTLLDKWIEIKINTDNIRCDVVKLLTDTLMNQRGVGSSEKHFPSRIALQITPTMQSNVVSISVSKSSENASIGIGIEKGMEASFEPSTALGLHFSTGDSISTTLRPWKFEQSVYGYTGNLNWFLHDSEDGREVFSSQPSMLALLHPKSWFKNRYSNANRPFTRQGGVVFAGDEYGESVSWKVDKGSIGRSMEWEIKGWIWLTYWPNKHKSFYSETRRLEFKEVVHLYLV